MKKIISIFLALIIMFSFPVGAEPLNLDGAKSYLLADFDSGTILEEKYIDEPRSIASLSKIVTYCVVMDQVKAGKLKLSDKITVTENAAKQGGSTFDLEVGDKMSVDELLIGLMLVSGNDAAVTLAEGVGGTEGKFVEMMNDFVGNLNLAHAKFYNATGLPLEDKSQNKMTARELLVVTRYAISEYPDILKITSMQKYKLKKTGYEVMNTNPLIGAIDGIDGLKTGMTDDAGYCLISTGIKKGNAGKTKDMRFIAIVLGTSGYSERKEVSLKLMKFAYDSFDTMLFKSDEPIGRIAFPSGVPNEANYYIAHDTDKLIKLGSTIKTKLNIKESITLPIKSGMEIGLVDYIVDGEVAMTVPAVVREDILKPSIFQNILSFYTGLFKSLDSKFLD